MSDDIYGAIDDGVYRSIAASFDGNPRANARNTRYLYDLTLTAVNYSTRPDQFEHLCHKWELTSSEVEQAARFIERFQERSW